MATATERVQSKAFEERKIESSVPICSHFFFFFSPERYNERCGCCFGGEFPEEWFCFFLTAPLVSLNLTQPLSSWYSLPCQHRKGQKKLRFLRHRRQLVVEAPKADSFQHPSSKEATSNRLMQHCRLQTESCNHWFICSFKRKTADCSSLC